ncbi:unnamed protein product [Knipowitschia caucasica]
MTSFITVPKVPQRLKQAITDKCVDFCTKDLRPFYTVSGEGFQALAQELINIGASYGRIAASSVLPHHGTISKACLEKAEMKREQLVSELKQTLASGDIGMSTDMWTDDYRKMSYIAITCHFINSDFLLVGKTLTTAVFPAEDAKTGKNIRRELLRLLINKFGLELSSLKNIVWVTDQGSNIIKALEPYRRLSCLDHLLNTVMRHGLDANNLTQNAPDISETITAAKSLVRHVKQSGLAAQLSKTVLQMAETRFSTVYLTLKSVLDVFPELSEKLHARGEQERIDNIVPDTLNFLICFLEPFYCAQRELEGDKYPTLNLVCLWVEKLKRHCLMSPTDSAQQAFVRKKHAEMLERKVELHIFHKVALFLWPKFNKLKMMSPADIFTVHAHVCTLLQSLGGVGESSAAADREASSSSSQQAPAPKRSRVSDFAEWENDDDSVTSEQDEVSLYITQKHAMADDRDLLGWWKINSNVYPKLSKLAKSVLCIPASSSSSERVFSAAGRTISERRTALKPSTVDAILFLHDAM